MKAEALELEKVTESFIVWRAIMTYCYTLNTTVHSVKYLLSSSVHGESWDDDEKIRWLAQVCLVFVIFRLIK